MFYGLKMLFGLLWNIISHPFGYGLLIPQTVLLTLKLAKVIRWHWLIIFIPAILFLVLFGILIYHMFTMEM